MKRNLILFFLICLSLPIRLTAANDETKLNSSNLRAQSMGTVMIAFIRAILEEEPKAIDETLVRDDE